jgi:hypothetical protein
MKEAIINALIRALRTFAQTALGVYLAGLVASPALGDLGSWTLIQAALAAGIIAVLWNLLESLGGAKYPTGLKG